MLRCVAYLLKSVECCLLCYNIIYNASNVGIMFDGLKVY